VTPAPRLIVADAVWVGLVLATLASTRLVELPHANRWTVPLLMVLAALKVHGVVAHFMELHTAPRPWRLAFGAWIVVCTTLIAAMHSTAVSH
jgi:Prokaryotic Cytochrome C oxidase subunit IV